MIPDIETPESPGFTEHIVFEDNLLKFDKISSYEDLLENQGEEAQEQLIRQIASNKGFISMQRFYTDQDAKRAYQRKNGRSYAVENPVEDEFLASILNPDGIVQIGEWLFKVNLEKDIVLAMNQKYKNFFYNDLVNEKIDNKQIYVYSTDDEVINLIKNGVYGTSEGGENYWWGCAKGASRKKEDDNDYVYNTTINTATGETQHTTYKARYKHVYQKAGIYFSLFSKLKYMKLDEGQIFYDPVWTDITLIYTYKLHERCRDIKKEGKSTRSLTNKRKLKRTYHSSARALRSYSISSQFKYLSVPSGQIRTVSLLDIQDN